MKTSFATLNPHGKCNKKPFGAAGVFHSGHTWMMRGLLGAVPHGEAPERSPFKAASRDKPLGTAIIQGGRTCTACEMKKHFNHMSLCLGLAVYRVRQY